MSGSSISHKFEIDDFHNHERKPTKMWTSWKNKFQPRKDPKNVTSNGHKWPLLQAQIEEKFQKKNCRQPRFEAQKYKKNWKSKNDLKSLLRAVNKELWAI